MKKLTSSFGYISVGLFVYLAVTRLTSNPQIFLNWHGLVIVVGGLFVASLASFPAPLLYGSLKSVFRSFFPTTEVSVLVAEETVALGSALQKGNQELERASESLQNPFLKQATNLVLEGIGAETILDILDKRIEEKRNQINNQMNVMLTLSKYSPALGLAATVLGLVDLLSQLQSADIAKLGYGMAIALSATFYGIIFSNLFFAPLSEMIGSCGELDISELEMIREGLAAALEKKHPLVIGEVVNSYLPEGNRINFIEKLKIENLGSASKAS